MTFKPMLASPIEDTSKLKFPVLASFKLDGVRSTKQSKLLSRNLKAIPNKRLQQKFSHLPEGLDGEFIFGDPTDEHAFSNTVSIVMSQDKDPAGVKFWAFDLFGNAPFRVREHDVYEAVFYLDDPDVEQVVQKEIKNEEELLEFEKAAIAAGYEGVMVRSFDGPYKQGRSSVREGYLLKLKRFQDAEAKILGFEEEQENTNEAKTNALGRTERSSKKEGMVGKGTLGKFEVVGINGKYKDVEFSIGGGFTALMRQEYWKNRKKLVGKIVKYKYFPTGSVEKPRFPTFLGFRDKRDM